LNCIADLVLAVLAAGTVQCDDAMSVIAVTTLPPTTPAMMQHHRNENKNNSDATKPDRSGPTPMVLNSSVSCTTVSWMRMMPTAVASSCSAATV